MAPVTNTRLRDLVGRSEGATLDFKRQMYIVQDRRAPGFDRNRDELIKDILGLVNNNAVNAGDESFLMIGSFVVLEVDGTRELYDVGDGFVEGDTILEWVNAACEPALAELYANVMELDGKRLIVIQLPSSPHLHETRRELFPTSAKHGYRAHTVFVRNLSGTDVASWRECDAIAKIKRLRHEERINPSAVPFGAALGAIIGGLLVEPLGRRISDSTEGAIAGVLVGTGLGSVMGGLLGYNWNQIRQLQLIWSTLSTSSRVLVVTLPTAGGLGAAWFTNLLRRQKKL